MRIISALRTMMAQQASDVHLTVGTPPAIRVHGRLAVLPDEPPCQAEELEQERLICRGREAGRVDRAGRRISSSRSVSAAGLPGRGSYRLYSAGITPQTEQGPGSLWAFPCRRSSGWFAVGNPHG